MKKTERPQTTPASQTYQRLVEKYKYITTIFQIESNYLGYIKAVFIYGLKRQIRFPGTCINLYGSRFNARENSMDIPHLSYHFEPETTELLIKSAPAHFIDIGAHIGRFSIILARRGCNVISFEPSADNFNQLKQNIESNNLKNRITTYNFGCSNVAEERDLFCRAGNEGMASFISTGDDRITERRQLRRLDAVCGDLPSVDAIKIDVEGFELNVLKGAVKILKQHAPILIIEIWEPEQERDITSFLDRLGYSPKKILDARNYLFIKAKNDQSEHNS